MKRGVFSGYSKSIKKVHDMGKSTEYSYRNVFETFLKSLIPKEYNVKIIHEPGRESFGAPDFKIFSNTKIIGYIETKAPDINLDKLPKRDKAQVKRYVERLENFILTNYRDFILYQNGEKVAEVSLLDDDFNLIERNVEKFERLLERFLSFSTPIIKEPKELAEFLAKRARILRDIVWENLDNNEELKALYKAFKEHLMSSMTKEEFADAYAQTIVYGLFMARFNLKGELTRERVVFRGIPKSLRVVHEIFKHITSELPDYLDWIVDEIITILNNVDVEKIETSFRVGNGELDPFLHFYEDFLAEYNPKLRKSKGVYYTPIPVVEFIINSVDELLAEKFGKHFEDKGIKILDPATGTGTFLAVVLEKIYKRHKGKLLEAYLKRAIIENLYGFEILISPYLVAHIKLSMLLNQWHMSLKEDERFNIYLTNALDLMREHKQAGLFERYLDEESEKADQIKKEEKIFAVIGNPPYESKRIEEEWGSELVEEYLHGLGVEDEKKKGVIQDYYIGFIRFAQWKIDQNGRGIVGFITNNSYLDGRIHRRMRQSLMESFDEIYILNLHGNAIKGDSDENVFDIKQGVTISLFVKLREGKHKAEECKVYYYSIVHNAGRTTREEKYEFLRNNTVKTIKWKELNPKEPYYFFVPKDLSLEGEYLKFKKLDEIFEVYSSGVETQNDDVTIAFTREEIKQRIRDFVNLPEEELRLRYKIKDKSVWNLKTAQEAVIIDVNQLGDLEKALQKRLTPLLYRPFDFRWTYYLPKSSKFIGRPRYKVMKHFLLGSNLGLVLPKLSTYEDKFSIYAIVTDKPADKHTLLAGKAVINKSITVIFPLYRYIENKLTGKLEKVPNIKKEFLKLIKEKYNATPEDFLYYIYAVLHDPKYRKRYAEFLKFDFPRIPLYDKETFEKYKEIGKELVELHLMKKDIPVLPKVEGEDFNVEKVKYDKKKQGVWINKTTILLGIPEEIWEYKIGGYRVIEKYLKGRKGRELTLEEIEHIYKVVEILKRTIELVKKLEEIEPKFNEAS